MIVFNLTTKPNRPYTFAKQVTSVFAWSKVHKTFFVTSFFSKNYNSTKNILNFLSLVVLNMWKYLF